MSSSQIVTSVLTVIFPAAMIFAGIMDLLTLKIRNVLVIGVAVVFFVAAPIVGLSLYEIGLNVGVAAIVLAVSFGFFAAGWIGGGDAKLAAATALWFGWEHVLPYLVISTLAGGLLTLMIIGFRSMLLPASFYSYPWLVKLHESKTGVPYGIAFAIAALIVFPDTVWFKALI
jgi:prepilin peptidase CpaA